MPYKDKVQMKEYQRQWYQRKKAGLSTRTTPKLTEKQVKTNTRKHRMKYSVKERSRRKSMIEKAFGNECYICKTKNKRLIAHKKDGKSHQLLQNMRLEIFDEALKTNDYVRLCFFCHKGVHWMYDQLGLNWTEVEEALRLIRQ